MIAYIRALRHQLQCHSTTNEKNSNKNPSLGKSRISYVKIPSGQLLRCATRQAAHGHKAGAHAHACCRLH